MKSRRTKQKDVILEEISSMKSFFNAEELYSTVQKRDKSIGIATVYRHLNRLKRAGKIHAYLCKRKTIYSSSLENHCHFICKQCGNMSHFEVHNLDFLQKKFEGTICCFQIE